ncbi:13810_t:CDS:2 [Dentiscutata erythropus]|uniref:13810_t:CDS:1 n=1 Tax=Dentiscutata erythropus TaxID=1348616 RepID=A0A9N8YQ62_9GLOM|nr:13810_t:CDS:2 [Dentiscutata erythropus]
MKFCHFMFLFIYGLVSILLNIISNSIVDANSLPAQFKDIQPLICRQLNEKPSNAPSLVVTSNIDPKDPTQHLYGGPASDQPYLLGFSTEGKEHVILLISLPEITDNIVTTVPGVGSGLNDALYQSLSINDATSEILKGSDGDINKNTQIIWVGYDISESPVDVGINFFTDILDFGLTKLSIALAVAAGSALNLFQWGLITIHKGTAPHITVVGHSYGSDVVVETTMNGLKLVADDVILIASLRVPVDHASQIANNMVSSNPGSHNPKTQVWASKTGEDPICRISNSLETDTISKSFGASVFFSEPRGDHGGYWYGIGLTNMAFIILENYHSVLTGI